MKKLLVCVTGILCVSIAIAAAVETFFSMKDVAEWAEHNENIFPDDMFAK